MDKSKMYGLLHGVDGKPIERHVRFLKVGFGISGSVPDIQVALTHKKEAPWRIDAGKADGRVRTEFATKAEAIQAYARQREQVIERKYPSKFPYFTFSRMGIDGKYVPDFDAIEQHGPLPTEIDVVFLTENPFDSAFEAWTAAELKCEGNGIDARRRLDWAANEEEKKLADKAKAAGEKFFPIIGKCFTGGCPYPIGDKPKCKPHGRLYFQLMNSPRVGGSCTYDTTGYKSVSQIFSCIQQIKAMTGKGDPEMGRISGIPLKFIMRPYKVSHNGKPSVQYAVSLEHRAKNAVELARVLNHHAQEYREAAQLDQLQIAAAPETENTLFQESIQEKESPYENEAHEAGILNGEFYDQFEDAEEDEEFPEEAAPIAPDLTPKRKSESKQVELLNT